MPLTAGLTTRKGVGHIHSDKWHRCVDHVKAQGGGYEPHAVCTASIGYSKSINKEHRTPGEHASTKHRVKKMNDVTFAQVLKFNPHHDTKGRFASHGTSGAAPDQGEHHKAYLDHPVGIEKASSRIQGLPQISPRDGEGLFSFLSSNKSHGVREKGHFWRSY